MALVTTKCGLPWGGCRLCNPEQVGTRPEPVPSPSTRPDLDDLDDLYYEIAGMILSQTGGIEAALEFVRKSTEYPREVERVLLNLG